MARGKHTPIDVREAVAKLALRYPDATAPAIGAHLARDQRFAGRIPEERTLQALLRPLRRRPDPSEAWSLRDVPPESARDAGIVLQCLARVWQLTDKRVTFLTRDEADMVIRIRHADLRVDAAEAYFRARQYLARGRQPGTSTIDLDLSLALHSDGQEESLFPTSQAGAAQVAHNFLSDEEAP